MKKQLNELLSALAADDPILFIDAVENHVSISYEDFFQGETESMKE